MPTVAIDKPKTAIEKKTRTTVDTISLTAERIAKWKRPDGQRPLRENRKVREIAETIREDGGVVPGILTLGVLDGAYWIIDGQHRLHAFGLSGVKEGYADVRYFYATSMADINREYVELNSRLVTMRPDDFLRGMEGSIAALSSIRQACPYVGYDHIYRSGKNATVLSMAATIRSWKDSQAETPARGGGESSIDIALGMIPEEVSGLVSFLGHAYIAFGSDAEYARLWGTLNMTLCAWLYRRLVLGGYSQKTPRIGGGLFQKCLLSVSADNGYQDWLMGRRLSERDRAPAYSRVKAIFARRLEQELGKKVQLPAPSWT